MIYLRVRLRPTLAPPGSRVSWTVRFNSLWKVWGVSLVFLLVMGGIFLGWFTPTEGAGIGAVGALFVAAITGNMNRVLLSESFGESIRLTAMIVAILIGASVFAQFIAITGLTAFLADWAATLPVDRYVILLVLVMIYLALGCLMDVVGMIVLTIPVFMPVVTRLGFDPIWFGIMVTVLIEVSLITPPVGTNVIIIQRISGLPSSQVFAGVLWFLVVEMIVILALICFPILATWLPDMMLG
jgi:tripartite ATP-independent transporter DctM subunit